MSTVGSGGTLVPGAACIPARYGLLSVAEIDDRAETEGHWQNGFSQWVESCQELMVLSNDCPPTPENKNPSLDGNTTFDGDPFTLVSGYKCSVGGSLPLSTAWDYAERRLSQGEARAVERTFWTGVDSVGNPIRNGLGSADADVVDTTPTPGTAVSLTDGVSLLEEWAGENMSCAPVVHASRGVSTYLAERRLVESSGQVLIMTGTGSRVSVGGGYLRTGPEGVAVAEGEAWLFITGAIKVLRSPMYHTPSRGDEAAAVNREINDVTVFAERTYGFTRECGIAAVLVTLESCCV